MFYFEIHKFFTYISIMNKMHYNSKTIKGVTHYLYTTHIDFKRAYPEYEIIKTWRKGNEGDWVSTDDGGVVQILKKGLIADKNGNKKPYIRTICGTFLTESNSVMENVVAENIYTFSGTNEYKRFIKKEDVSSREVLFARYLASGENAVSAYKRAYSTKNDQYAKARSTQLLKTKRIQAMISEEVKKVLDEEGVSPNYIISKYKQISDIGENDATTLRALDSLAKISGLFETKENVKEQLTVWQGFTPEQLEHIKQEKLLGHAEKDK